MTRRHTPSNLGGLQDVRPCSPHEALLSNDHKKPWPRKGGQKHAGKPWKPGGGARHRNARPQGAAAPGPVDGDGMIRLFGMHAVEAALANARRPKMRLLATENAERRLREGGAPIEVAIERTTPRDLDRLLGAETVHQGLMLEAGPLPEPDLDELIRDPAPQPIVVLDQVTDPHNVGAVLRSAAVFGSKGLVMTRRHSPPLNGVLAKSASAALELVPIALVQNLARAMDELKGAGYLVIGLDGEADEAIEDMDWTQPAALVLGAEGKGLRELTRKMCDRLARISTDGSLGSLNVSNAAAVALHSAMVGRRK